MIPARTRLLCPDCGSTGMRSVGRMASDRSGQGGTMLIPEACQVCAGEGWISPFRTNGKPDSPDRSAGARP